MFKINLQHVTNFSNHLHGMGQGGLLINAFSTNNFQLRY